MVSFNGMFLDEAEIWVQSGRGGDGSAHFRREKFVPRGGPDGGDGGRGGDVVLIGDVRKWTLQDFRLNRKFLAEDGRPGGGSTRTGKSGKSVEIPVPLGTVVRDADSGVILADLIKDGERVVVCAGGRGGRGNCHFASSVRQAPTFAEKGEPGQRRRLLLELKLIADVGLVGLPNAGKSTLVSSVSAAKPKIADYPFTTLTPQLGIVSVDDSSFVIADLPGLIEGASEGRGLGHRFLRHAERTRVLVHVVECAPLDGSDPVANFMMIREELRCYSSVLASKPAVITLSKIDLLSDSSARSALLERFSGFGLQVFALSAVTGEGMDAFLRGLARILAGLPREPLVETVTSVPVESEADWEVITVEGGYAIRGTSVERLVSMTDISNMEALQRLHRQLEGLGVIDRLRELGASDGSEVRIGDFEFVFSGET